MLNLSDISNILDKDCEVIEGLKHCICAKSLIDNLIVTCDGIVNAPETTPMESVDKKGYYLSGTIFPEIICLMFLISTAITFIATPSLIQCLA